MDIKTVGVIGAGQMGNGIAHVSALAGYDVILNDISSDALERAVAVISKNLDRQVARERITPEQHDATLKRIQTTDNIAAMHDADLAIEAATEKEEVKRQIFSTLCPHLKQGAYLATNTSSISITRLAASTDRPERFIGLHFMNPVPVMKLVEIIRGIATDEPTYHMAQEMVGRLGKFPPMPKTSPPSS